MHQQPRGRAPRERRRHAPIPSPGVTMHRQPEDRGDGRERTTPPSPRRRCAGSQADSQSECASERTALHPRGYIDPPASGTARRVACTEQDSGPGACSGPGAQQPGMHQGPGSVTVAGTTMHLRPTDLEDRQVDRAPSLGATVHKQSIRPEAAPDSRSPCRAAPSSCRTRPVRRLHRVPAEPGREDAVVRRRRAAALDMPQDDGPRLLAEPMHELCREPSPDPGTTTVGSVLRTGSSAARLQRCTSSRAIGRSERRRGGLSPRPG